MVLKDYVKGIETYIKALTLVYREERPAAIEKLERALIDMGMIDLAERYMDDKLAKSYI